MLCTSSPSLPVSFFTLVNNLKYTYTVQIVICQHRTWSCCLSTAALLLMHSHPLNGNRVLHCLAVAKTRPAGNRDTYNTAKCTEPMFSTWSRNGTLLNTTRGFDSLTVCCVARQEPVHVDRSSEIPWLEQLLYVIYHLDRCNNPRDPV
jgi:hypothetical protein